jgi:ribosomal protein L35AE/L33A
MKRFRIFAAALSVLVFTACFQDGGDDIPNSVEPMGKHAAAERADSSEWNAYDDAPSGASGMYDTAHVPNAPPSQGAPKRGVLQVLPSLEMALGSEVAGAARAVQSDTGSAPGVVRTVRTQLLGSFFAADTTWYKVEGSAVRVVRVSGKVSFAGDVRYTAFEDGDGDGYLSPAGAGSVVQIRQVTILASGRREEQTRRVGAGPDNDFNRAGDNSLQSLQKVAMHALDTLLSLVVSDLDGDGFLYNPLRDSNKIGVESKMAGDGGRTDLSYRVNVFADSTRNYAYRYRKVFTSARGIEETTALGRDSLPDFAPGDSGSVRVRFTSTVTADTLASSYSRYAVRLSSLPGDAAGNRLIQVDREKTFRAGPVSVLRFSLKPAVPVPDGSFARDGALFVRADLRAGGWVQFAGQAAADISGTVTDSEGRSGVVRIRLDGTVKSGSGF